MKLLRMVTNMVLYRENKSFTQTFPFTLVLDERR